MSGSPPDFKMNFKPKGSSGKGVDLFAWWKDDAGKIKSGMMDKGVKAIKVLTTEGEVITITREGQYVSGFVNLYDNTQPRGASGAPKTATPGKGGFSESGFGDDFAEDDCPF